MKLIRTPNRTTTPPPEERSYGARHLLKLLVVDDEPDIRQLTRLNLRGFRFAERELQILEAASAEEARAILSRESDIAVALIDVVMESDDAGLRLVEYIRHELKNRLIRLIIRTGQPGLAPERSVIDTYDIDDYKDKTELTATRLYTTVRSAMKSYCDLRIIDLNRMGLQRVLEAAPDIYRISNRSINQFFQGVLTQIIGLCNLSESSFIATTEPDGVIATFAGSDVTLQAAVGSLARQDRFEQIRTLCIEAVQQGVIPEGLRKGAFVVPLLIKQQPQGFIYIEPIQEFTEADRSLIAMVAQQCSSAMENLRLHSDLLRSYDHMIEMLAGIAEYKDRITGNHIRRIDDYTRLLAVELGVSEEEAVVYGRASRLHDVGKVGIPDAILSKPGKLNAEEFAVIRTHTRIGEAILQHDDSLALARDVALHHHERWDGTGYPEGRPSAEFPLVTRIVSVVDVFDALISQRSYKAPWPPEQAVAEIERGAGTQFDPVVVAAFSALYRRGAFDSLIASAQYEAVGSLEVTVS